MATNSSDDPTAPISSLAEGVVVPIPTFPLELCTVKLPGPDIPPANVLVAVVLVATKYPARAELPKAELPSTESLA